MNRGFAVLTVSQLNLYVRSLLENDPRLNGIFLRGEISNFTDHYRSGHLYLSLKDENAVIRAVMFRSSAQNLRFRPQNGMRVIVYGRASLYDRDGQYQFYIEDMQPDGVGALQIAYEQLKQKLNDEGLFDPARKKPLPAFPHKIGVITSPTGAALQDILTIIGRRWPLAEVVLRPVLVQGDAAPEQIADAVRRINEQNGADVLIVGRGGGSIEELWAFNDERVARAVAESVIPVVSAVGHETDFTICDFAADLRAPTPSAAAELVTPDLLSVKDEVRKLGIRLNQAINADLSEMRSRLNAAVSSKAMKSPMIAVDMARMKLDLLLSRAQNVEENRISKAMQAFAGLAGRLDSLSPLKVLTRGYAIPMKPDGTVAKKACELSADELLSLRLADGTAECRVLSVNPDI